MEQEPKTSDLFKEFYHPEEMRIALAAPFSVWATAPGAQRIGDKADERHIFFNRGSKILAVAHLDSVQHFNGFMHDKVTARLYSATVDDRIGLWTIMYVLPRLGINVDVLLTDHEEIGQSTGKFFKPEDNRYNWMVQFDRGVMGARKPDWVSYQYYHNKIWTKALEEFMPVSEGANSCIARMDHLGICGVNAQTGMSDYHSKSAFVDTVAWADGLKAFMSLHEKYADTKFDFDPARDKRPVYYYGRGNGHGHYTPVKWSCEFCGKTARTSQYPAYNESLVTICADCVYLMYSALSRMMSDDLIAVMLEEETHRISAQDKILRLNSSGKKKESEVDDEDYSLWQQGIW